MDLAVSAHHSFLGEMTINNPLVSLYFLLFSVLLCDAVILSNSVTC